jgi:hypothetical protein
MPELRELIDTELDLVSGGAGTVMTVSGSTAAFASGDNAALAVSAALTSENVIVKLSDAINIRIGPGAQFISAGIAF